MMSLKKISYEFVEDSPLFSEISIVIPKNDRLCLVGENGAGKSTFLKIMAGELAPSEGARNLEPHTKILYVPQEFNGHNETIHEYLLKHATAIGEAMKLITEFGFDIESRDIKKVVCRELSGGEQKAIMMGIAFSNKPNILLLDEPENHFDIIARKHLLNSMQYFQGSIVFISHDQTTLTNVTKRVLEIIDKQGYLTEGGYHEFKKARAKRVEVALRDRVTLEKQARKLQDSLVIMHQKAFRGKNTGDYHSRKEDLAEMKEELKNSKKPSGEQSKKLNARIVDEDRAAGRFVFESDKLCYRYPGATNDAVRSDELYMSFGDRIGLVGRNGAGKTTFLKILAGTITPTFGTMRFGPDVSYEIFNQHMHIDESMQLLEAVKQECKVNELEAFRILGGAKLSSKTMSSLRINELSGGQRMRLRFAIAFSKPLDLIILDEPTNNLDESTLEILHELINGFGGAVLIISHDRQFMEDLELHKFWYIEKQTLTETHKPLKEIIKIIEAESMKKK